MIVGCSAFVRVRFSKHFLAVGPWASKVLDDEEGPLVWLYIWFRAFASGL